MTMALENTAPRNRERDARRNRQFALIGRIETYIAPIGLGFLPPLARILLGEAAGPNLAQIWRVFGAPLVTILLFLTAWAWAAPKVDTSLGAIPGPAQVWEQAGTLYEDHVRGREREAAFYERLAERNRQLVEMGRADDVRQREYTGPPTYFDQIWTSLQTVFFGFAIATIVAVPLGIACGLSPTVNAGLNPLIQIFKPVSPLAWLPIVTMVVSATVETGEGWIPKSFLVSAITVTLCSMWPTLINTALGVASIDRDLVNVGRVLNLSAGTQVFKLILPSALPLIFTGLRLSLGVGWMVLIAAEMLAQNPGIGKFVWDEFQNGSSDSLAKIIVAVFTIGIVGFLLDRLMVIVQSAFTHSAQR
jgi:nitrate/nitrite transport system permease protein